MTRYIIVWLSNYGNIRKCTYENPNHEQLFPVPHGRITLKQFELLGLEYQ